MRSRTGAAGAAGAALVLALAIAMAWPGAALAQEPAPASPPDFEPPVLVEFVSADYPAEARAAGLEAVVVLTMLVGADGTVTDVLVTTGAGHGFDEAAALAAQQFTWTPGHAKGKPVPVRVTYAYRFTLDEAPAAAPAEAPDQAPDSTGVIEGELYERGTRVPIVAAGVVAVPANQDGAAPVAETTTDTAGRFRLEGLPPGRYLVIVGSSEHRRGRFAEEAVAATAVRVRYYLERKDYNPYQTTVVGDAQREEIERRAISIDEATRIPGTRGDALRAVESFPGVARPPFGSGLLVVRGANPEDSASYIAGHWVPLTYHFGGLTSVVNSDLLSRLDYLPGNFSARFGRAIGAIVDVDVRAPKRERWTGYVDADVIDAGFLLEGPVGDGSLAIAARRSYIDAVFTAIVPDDSGLDFSQAPVYYDYQLLWATPVAGGRLTLFVFGVDDQLRFAFGDPSELDPSFRGDARAHTGFHRAHATFRKELTPTTELTLSAASGYGAVDFSVGPGLAFSADFFFNSYRAELAHRPFEHVRVIAGTEGQFFPYVVDVAGPRPPAEGEVPTPPSSRDQFVAHDRSFEWTPAFYLEAALDVGHGLTVTPGARFDWYRVADAFVADPRLSVRWEAGRHTTRFGLGRFSQEPQPYETNAVFGNPDVNPEHAVHLSLGHDVQLSGPIKLETTFYYKWMQDLIVRSDERTLRESGRVDSIAYTNDGVGRVIGAEVLLRHELGRRFFGWVSYSISKSERRDGPGLAFRPFQLDQTHVLSLVGSWKLPWRMEAGFRFRFVTGNPETPVVGSIYDADADVYFPIPGVSGSERVGAFHQLDVRVDRRWVFDKWMLTAYLDIQNAYNRLNPEGYFYSYDYRDKAVVSGLPIIPSIGVKGEF